MNSQPGISVIIPVFNEGASVRNASEKVIAELSSLPESYEIIFVDDGSDDDSFTHLEDLAVKNPVIKAIRLSSNHGSHMAIRAGLSYATGKYACFIACDMQEPPSLIPEMKKKVRDGINIVWAVRNSRGDSMGTILFAKLFYWLARNIVTKNIPPTGASMFMVSDKVLSVLNKYDERNLTLEGLFATMGFKSDYVYYNREQRKEGKSKWTFSKKMKLFIDFFIAYSNFPIRFVSVTGILFSLCGFAWTIYIIIRQIFVGDLAPGWPALVSILLIGFGITNISLGIIAEYLWRTLDEARKRPKYVVEKAVNLNDVKNL